MRKKYVILLISLLVIGVAVAGICIANHLEEAKLYDLNELELYFQEAPLPGGWYTPKKTVYLSDANRECPAKTVRDIRGGKYSVYEVKPCGRYYVFWSPSEYSQSGEATDHRADYAIYLCGNRSAKDFDSLQLGQSTWEDVQKIDPYAETNLWGYEDGYSWSYLNKDKILKIKYKYTRHIIEEINIVPRAANIPDFSSYEGLYISRILREDLP